MRNVRLFQGLQSSVWWTTHLSDDLIWALYEDLHRPPVVISHPIQKPLKQKKNVIKMMLRPTETAPTLRRNESYDWTSQAAWLLLNCLVRSSIHCSMVGWRRQQHIGQFVSDSQQTETVQQQGERTLPSPWSEWTSRGRMRCWAAKRRKHRKGI